MLPELDELPEPDPEREPLDVEPEPLVVAPEDELPEPDIVPVELDDEPGRALEPDDVLPEPVALPEPESILPVAAPPRGPLSFTCAWHPANANAPARIGIANNLFFIRHLLSTFSRRPRKRSTRGKTHGA